MDTQTILRVLQFLFRRGQVGCVPCNELDRMKIKKYPFAICVNDQPWPQGGMHWTGMYIKGRNEPLEFFCSYGKPMQSYPFYFVNFARRNKLKIVQSNICLQSPFSTVCGQHVIYYLFNRMKGCNRAGFYAKFSKDVNKNDECVRTFVNKIVKQI